MKVQRLRDDELKHHGVKGQRWGVRRYQNYDGSLIKSNGKKSTIKKLKTYNKNRYQNNRDTSDSFNLEKEVKSSLTKNQLNTYKKAFKNKDNEEFKLEEMKWDTYKSKGKDQIKKVNQATKEYETVKTEIAKELIGKKYSKKKIGIGKDFGQITIKRGKDVVGEILDEITRNTSSEYYGWKNYYEDMDSYYNKKE